MNNNLFQYATSELSQDAFICWLLSYAIKDCEKDEVLTECAKEFLRFFIPELKDEPVYLSEPPRRQYKSIDVLVTVNDKYKVIIEDKTHTSEHDNQLIRYRQTVNEDFPEYKCIGIYYKIGFQSDMGNVIDAGFVVCDREKILSVLSKYISLTSNDIFMSYYEYLNEFNTKANKFTLLPVEMWEWEQINGFYKYCQDRLTDIGFNFGFGYVHNPSGGFYGMWIWKPIYIQADGLECEVYLQCEFANGVFNICYKASSKTDKIKRNNREALIWKYADAKWVDIAKKHNFNKPLRYGTGKAVTLAVYKAKIKTYEEAVSSIKNAIADFNNIVDEINN